ncbi:MAG: tyrosine-type recombinase/integrase, partial [Holophagales bacterium]|nr:tyrosine-type recombinase/integrase [Holophagales bacterium]
MHQTKRGTKLATRSTRLKLEIGIRVQEPLSRGCYLVYRRPSNSSNNANGKWSVCWVNPKTKIQTRKTIGIADDFRKANNKTILTYTQAKDKAIEWFEEKSNQFCDKVDETIPNSTYTVADALEDYLKDGERRGMKGANKTRMSANAWIIPTLGSMLLSELTRVQLESWLDTIAATPHRIRTKIGGEPAYAPPPTTEDEKRARKDTANRILSILKAALNFAVDHHLTEVTDPSWQKVKSFRGTSTSRIRFLNLNEQVRLIEACSPEFKNLVRGALLTGCRYGELTRLQCKDYSPNSGIPTIFVAESKSGKPRHIVLTAEGASLFAELTVRKENPDDLIFTNSAKRIKRTNTGDGWLESD